jgi:glycerol uptake facilitator-like aquaporin
LNRSLARALVAELIGTFALIFAGAGAIMVDCAAATNKEAA